MFHMLCLLIYFKEESKIPPLFLYIWEIEDFTHVVKLLN